MSLEVVEKVNEDEAAVKHPPMSEHVALYNVLITCQDLPGLRFAKKVADNIKMLEVELAPLNEILTPTPEFTAFAQKVQEEAGGDVEKIKEFESKEPELIKARQAQIDVYQGLLAEEKKLSLRRIPSNDLPKEMTARQYRGLQSIIYG
mgnify:CR=1 FL=1